MKSGSDRIAMLVEELIDLTIAESRAVGRIRAPAKLANLAVPVPRLLDVLIEVPAGR